MDDFLLKAGVYDEVRREISLKRLEILARLSALQNKPNDQNLKNAVLCHIQDAIDGDKKTIIAFRELHEQEGDNWIGGTAKRVLQEIKDPSLDGGSS